MPTDCSMPEATSMKPAKPATLPSGTPIESPKHLNARRHETYMRSICVLLITAGPLLLGATPLLAHHAFSAEFDAKRPVHLEGIISRVEFINPHVWIHVDVTAQDGKVATWM